MFALSLVERCVPCGNVMCTSCVSTNFTMRSKMLHFVKVQIIGAVAVYKCDSPVLTPFGKEMLGYCMAVLLRLIVFAHYPFVF